MRILHLNTVLHGSTGKIMLQIAEKARERGHKCWVSVPRGRHNTYCDDSNIIWIGNRLSEDFHIAMGRLTGYQGCFSIYSTYKFIDRLNNLKPDILHFHNLHDSYINLPILFNYIKKNNIKVIWTLHDCWSFTGHCPYFSLSKCEKWKWGCGGCPSIKEYPKSYVDKTRWLWEHKRKWFTNVDRMTIVTPSIWLSQLVKQSYLSKYPVKVINNGIDLDIFRYRESSFREKYCLVDKKIILGVAFGWEKRKGLDIFVRLAKSLPETYTIVLVGTDEIVERKLPKNILKIRRTNNQKELAEIYSTADIFLNPTREENYPSVNMESIACGTPVITFNTGGSPEIILNDSCGTVLNDEKIENVIQAIENEISKNNEDNIRIRKLSSNYFDMNSKFYEYIKLYEDLI